MDSKIATIIAIGGLLVLLMFTIVAGGGTVTSSAEAPTGGCVVSLDPGHSPTGTATGTSPNHKNATLNANQMATARTIVAVGKGMTIAERGIAIALGTAMQESTLDPTAANGRSIGLFQQQGELYQHVNRTDPAAASHAFYEQLLQRVPNYAAPASGTFADIAQTVQQSGAGAITYAEWENWATTLAHQLITGIPGDPGNPTVVCEAGGGPGPIPIERSGREVTLPTQSGLSGTLVFPHDQAAIAGAAALSYLGTPYAWGGGGPNGPTQGIRDGGIADAHGDYNKNGFDCSGLTEYAWAQAGIAIGGDSRTQWATAGTHHPYNHALPGDLLFWGSGDYNNIHHVALYLGTINGKSYMVESPQSGDTVKVSLVPTGGDFRNTSTRPWG